MSGEVISHVFDELCRLGSCSSRTKFSTDWLGREGAYYRTVVARGEAVSVEAQAHLAATLRNIGMVFVKSEFELLCDKGAAMIRMHGVVLEDLFERVTLNAVSFEAE